MQQDHQKESYYLSNNFISNKDIILKPSNAKCVPNNEPKDYDNV